MEFLTAQFQETRCADDWEEDAALLFLLEALTKEAREPGHPTLVERIHVSHSTFLSLIFV